MKAVFIFIVLLIVSCQKPDNEVQHPHFQNVVLTHLKTDGIQPTLTKTPMLCYAKQIPAGKRHLPTTHAIPSTVNTLSPLLTLYREYDYTFFQHFHSDSATAWAYINQHAIYSIAQALQDDMRVTYINKLWTTPDPYNQTDIEVQLDTFGIHMEALKPKADLFQLIQMRNNTGGLSWIGGLCATDLQYRCSVCYVFGDLSGMTTPYRDSTKRCWDVQAALHEQLGHGCGSNHDHDCDWNGNNTKIDDAPLLLGWTVPSCPPEPNPLVGKHGHIMSYDHLIDSVGIDLRLGFGDQPKALILANIFAADGCLTYHTTCTPVPIQASITINKYVDPAQGFTDVSLTAHGTGGTPYSYLWKWSYTSQLFDTQVITVYEYTLSAPNNKFSVTLHSSDICFSDTTVSITVP